MSKQIIVIPDIGLAEIFDYEPTVDEEQLIANAEIQAEKDVLDKII